MKNDHAGTITIGVLLGLALAAVASGVVAGELVPVQRIDGVWASSAAWGDVDNDGDNDLIVSGQAGPQAGCARTTTLYRNDGGRLVPTGQQFPGVAFGAAALADYDNDGDLDLALSGWDDSGAEILRLFRNDGAGGFSLDATQAALVGVRYSRLAWGDYTGDGALDLAVMGTDKDGRTSTILYKNEGHTADWRLIPDPANAGLIALSGGALSWGDYDGDGDLDLYASGFDRNGTRQVRVYRNHPAGTLSEDRVCWERLTPLSAGSAAWGDYDGDGNLDLAVSGWDGTWIPRIKVYRNAPAGTLVEQSTNLPTQVAGSVAWGDADNNGNLDLFVTGENSFSEVRAFLVRSDSDGLLTADPKSEQVLPLARGAAAWADFSGDGTLDLFVAGADESGLPAAVLLSNTEPVANGPPVPPDLLIPPLVTGSEIAFRWGEGTDDLTPAKRLTYNLRVGSRQNRNEVVSGSGPVGPGNVGSLTTWRPSVPLPEGLYFWSVSAVDGAYRRSGESETKEFWIQKLVSSTQPLADLERSAIAFGDYDNDGDSDLAIAGSDINQTARTLLYRNDGGALTERSDVEIVGVAGGTLAWADYDNDGDLDLSVGGGSQISVYTNRLVEDGTPSLSRNDAMPSALPKLVKGKVAWADYDNDGDLDLAVVGGIVSGGRSVAAAAIYRNNLDKGGSLEEDTRQQLVGVFDASAAWGDVDNDGSPDLVVAGRQADGRITTILYKNDAGVLRQDSQSSLDGVYNGAVAWGDFDSDGNLDLAACGARRSGSSDPFLGIYRNTGGLLTPYQTTQDGLRGTVTGSVAWGDYNHDGLLDLAVNGTGTNSDGSREPVSAIYNRGGGTLFTEDLMRYVKPVEFFSAVAWVDLNGDGDLDLVSSGRQTLGLISPISAINENIGSILNPNRPPEPPGGLMARPEGRTVFLSWDPAADDEAYGTPAPGLTYQIRVARISPDGSEQALAVSGVSEYGMGPIGGGPSPRTRVANLPDGAYRWQVRAVDNCLASSDWSGGAQFFIDTVSPVVGRVSVSPKVVGINGQVSVVVDFLDELTGMDTGEPPSVAFTPGPGETAVRLEQVSFSGSTWTGRQIIRSDMPSGDAVISIGGARDRQGNVMQPVASAAAGFRIDTAVPEVAVSDPAPGETGVPLRPSIRVTFSEAMEPASFGGGVEVFQMSAAAGERIPGQSDYVPEKRTLTFNPSEVLRGDTEYEARVSSIVSDSVGNRMKTDYSWRFTTANVIEAVEGGRIENRAGTVSLFFPPRTFDRGAPAIRLSELRSDELPLLSDANLDLVGNAYSFDYDSLVTFTEKVPILTIRLPAAGKIVSAAEMGNLAVFKQDPSDPAVWDRLGGTVDTDSSWVAVPIGSLPGTFAIMADRRAETPTPAASPVTGVKSSPRVFSRSGARVASRPLGVQERGVTISFVLGKRSDVTIRIYDESGRLVRRLTDARSMSAGPAAVSWNGLNEDGDTVSSGLYIVAITADGVAEQMPIAVVN